MLQTFKKVALGTALLAASASSFAALPFTVDASAAAGFPTTFEADEIAGTYNEVVLVDALAGTFEATVLLDFTSFLLNGNGVSNTGLSPSVNIPGIGYRLYAIVDFDGAVTAGAPDFKTGFWSGDIEMYLDPNFDTPSNEGLSLDGINSTTASFDALAADDQLLFDATIDFGQSNGTVDSGSFSLNASLSNDPVNDPSLTPAGEAFFIEPDPFYNMLISFGNLNDFFKDVIFNDPNLGLQRFNSGANVNFVPSPSGVALLGLGLFALAYRSRKA
ncbi:MAG: flocculation-associated PEP-CTERM protein PepA [Glaciecola sp.]